MKRLALVALLAAPAVAQETSDLMPPLPQPPAGTSGYVYPGAPMPPREEPARPPPASSGAKGSEEKPPPPRIPGRLLGSSERDYTVEPEPEEEIAPPVGPDNTHVVKKGDTLWEIAREYLRNPYAWPKLWSYNPSITNPHWIYPGEIVRLAPPGTEPIATPVPTQEPRSHGLPPIVPVTGVFLRQTGFVEPGELNAAGKIVGSKEEKLMLATLDEAYVDFGKQPRPHTGDRFTVYQPMREVRHPVTKKLLGHIVQIFGEVEVQNAGESKLVRVTVVDCNEDMSRGFRVGPLKRQFKLVEPKMGSREMAGVVIATLHPRDMVSAQTLVFVDRGKKDGLEVGNRMQIVRRGDGYQPLRQSGIPIDDRRFPRESIGELLIVDTHDDTAAALVTRSVKETEVGDRVETKSGY